MRSPLPLDHLEIAVLFDGLLSVMEAAGQVDPRAEELLFRTVPPPLMEAAGFLDPRQPTTSPRFTEALDEGRLRLRSELPTSEGVNLCRRLWTMAAIDGAITAQQIEAIHACGETLGIDHGLNDAVGVGLLRALARRGDEVLIPQAWVDGLGHSQSSTPAVHVERMLELPFFERALTLEGDAALLVGDEGSWPRLQAALARVLWILSGDTGRDLAAFCCLYTVFDEHGAGAERVAVFLAHTTTPPGPARIQAAEQFLEEAGLPMVELGEQDIPPRAFPTLALVEGELLQLWLPSESGPVALGLKRDDADDLAFIYGVEPHARAPRDFVDGVIHAVVG